MSSTIKLAAITDVPKEFPFMLNCDCLRDVVGDLVFDSMREIHQKDLINTSITINSRYELSAIMFTMYVVDNTDYIGISPWNLLKIIFLDGTTYICRVDRSNVNYEQFSTATITVEASILYAAPLTTIEEEIKEEPYTLLGRKLRLCLNREKEEENPRRRKRGTRRNA